MKLTFLFLLFFNYFLPLFEESAGLIQKKEYPAVSFIIREEENKIDVLIDGKLFTSYCWYDGIYKPILYPVYSKTGAELTRGYPLNPKIGERTDHMHQIGIWFNYGNVNGFDFWNNGNRGQKNRNGGEIKHIKVEKLSDGRGEGLLITRESWIDPTGKELLSERTEYHFIANDFVRIIDRITTLTATLDTVSFKDSKEGLFAFRVARQLELPSKTGAFFIDKMGKISSEKIISNEGVTGNYRSSEGIKGEEVWGTRAKWMDLHGNIGDEKITVIIVDHPSNQNYPTFWQARDYGLFAANPFGANDFTEGREVFNFVLPAGSSETFRYRIIIKSGPDMTDSEIHRLANDFAVKY